MIEGKDFRRHDWRFHKTESIEETLAYYRECLEWYQLMADATGMTLDQLMMMEMGSAARYSANASQAYMKRMEPIVKKLEEDVKDDGEWKAP